MDAVISDILKNNLNGNTATILVGDQEAYTVKIVRQATLKKLAVEVDDSAVTLDATFKETRYEYSAMVRPSAELELTATKTSTDAVVTINDGSKTTLKPEWNEDGTADVIIKVSGGEGTQDVVESVYTIHLTQLLFEGDGTKEAPYQIKTAEDLVLLRDMVADGERFAGVYFKMLADITLPDDWTPIGTNTKYHFAGNFDGDNHLLTVPAGGLPLIGFPVNASLSNLNIYGSKIAGYGVVNSYGKGATITIDNVTLKSGTQTLYSGFIGGYASGVDAVVIKNSTVEKGVVIGYSKDQKWVGSFAGEFNGTISNCVSYADVYGTEFVGGIAANKGQTMGSFVVDSCQFHGTVTGQKYVGGIVGYGYAGTEHGTVSAPNSPCVTIRNCTSTAAVSGNSYVGGILGAETAVAQTWDNGIGYIQNNSFTGTVSGSSYVGGIIGYYRSLNKYNVITGNYYASGCGASKGIGGVEFVDTNCATHETASGVTYFNTENGTDDCPEIAGCAWREAHNRTDDPLGADAAKLCRTDTVVEPVALELKVSGTYKTEYIEGEELNLNGIVLQVVYDKGEAKTLALKDVTVTGYDKSKIGKQNVTLAYGGLTADITVTVKSEKKEITVSVSLLGDAAHNSDADGKVHTLADGNLTAWLGKTSIKVDGNATAFDAVKKLLDDSGISFTYKFSSQYNSNYIDSINGLAEFTNGKNSGWMVTVNGMHINVGLSAYHLKDGDVIVMHYTDDYTKENGKTNDNNDAAEQVEKLIDAIGVVTLEKADKVEAARKAYDALTYAQKQQVTNYAKLTAAETKLAQLQKEADAAAAKKVEDLIEQLDEASETFEKDVKTAQTAYNALTANQKKLVENYAKLNDALKLLASEADQKAAETVEDMIAALTPVTLEREDIVKAARNAYEKLSKQQKALVDNLPVLETAEKTLAELKKAKLVRDDYQTAGDFLEAVGTPSVGSVGGEWMVIGLTRSEREVPNAEDYYDGVLAYVEENADESGRLHRAKSTENARLILALTAMNKDVTDVGGHNLLDGLSDMDYIQKQGINGPIWALIAFDSGNYVIPEGDVSRKGLIRTILDAQLEDGGWALSGELSDPDMTGMALQALANYYEKDEAVKEAVDKAVQTLSVMQNADGSFATVDGVNSESVAQVITALSALGIDANTDPRFVKNGVSALDALWAFFAEDSGFAHLPDGETDGMATEQAYYALTAYYRMLDGKTNLYDMTDIIDCNGAASEFGAAETAENTEEQNVIVQWSINLFDFLFSRK